MFATGAHVSVDQLNRARLAAAFSGGYPLIDDVALIHIAQALSATAAQFLELLSSSAAQALFAAFGAEPAALHRCDALASTKVMRYGP
ncbi:MAG: hypothetical protein WA210_02770 [Burkholderiaceae bacterium]